MTPGVGDVPRFAALGVLVLLGGCSDPTPLDVSVPVPGLTRVVSGRVLHSIQAPVRVMVTIQDDPVELVPGTSYGHQMFPPRDYCCESGTTGRFAVAVRVTRPCRVEIKAAPGSPVAFDPVFKYITDAGSSSSGAIAPGSPIELEPVVGYLSACLTVLVSANIESVTLSRPRSPFMVSLTPTEGNPVQFDALAPGEYTVAVLRQDAGKVFEKGLPFKSVRIVEGSMQVLEAFKDW